MEYVPEMYVSDPQYIKDGMKGFTFYSLKGGHVPETINRRYRDFEALRKKMVERWPGICIPKLANKKKVGNKGKNISIIRVEMLNRFLKKISKINYLLNSEELKLFLQNKSNVGKIFDGLKEQSYEELAKKYFSTFIEYDTNLDTITEKNEQDKFEKQLMETLPKIKNFLLFVSAAMERYRDEQENYAEVINMLSLYEKESLTNFVNDEEDKLVILNTKNQELGQNISDSKTQLINPYDRLYSAITEDYLNCESMIEALEGLKTLQDTYNKLNRTLSNVNIELSDLQSGKNTMKTMFKNKDKEITKLNNEKNNLEKSINELGEVIKVATFNMKKEIDEFKICELNDYYAELSRIENDTSKNSKIFDDLWENIIKDKNISEFK